MEVKNAGAGDIVTLSGIPDINVGETITTEENAEILPAIEIDPPTVSMNFLVNNSPFAGKEGKLVTTRHIKTRLRRKETKRRAGRREIAGTDATRCPVGASFICPYSSEDASRGIRAPGVAAASHHARRSQRGKEEPMEQVIIDVPEECTGTVIDLLSRRKGELVDMKTEAAHTRLEFKVPTRGLLGFRGEFIIETGGEGILTHSS